MNVAFHCYQLSLRGTEVALYDYANNNEDILGNTSYIFTRAGGYQHSSIAEKFQRRFPARVFSYSTIQDLEVLLQANRIDTLYVIKSGGDDGLVSKVCRTAVHAVFQVKQPHGDAYAYVSEWLAGKMSGGSLPFVPHMIDLTGQGSSLRDRYGIPRGAMVYGRYGAPDTFDLDFVHEAIKRTVAARTRHILPPVRHKEVLRQPADNPHGSHLGGFRQIVIYRDVRCHASREAPGRVLWFVHSGVFLSE